MSPLSGDGGILVDHWSIISCCPLYQIWALVQRKPPCCVTYVFIISAEGEGYVFISVSLFVTRERIFMTFSGKVGLGTRNNLKHIGEAPLIPLSTGFFPKFSGESVTVPNITEKRLNGLSWNFEDTLNIRQDKLWNILILLPLTLGARGWFFLIPCLLATLRKKTGERIFMNISGYVGDDTTKHLYCTVSRLPTLFHGPQY